MRLIINQVRELSAFVSPAPVLCSIVIVGAIIDIARRSNRNAITIVILQINNIIKRIGQLR